MSDAAAKPIVLGSDRARATFTTARNHHGRDELVSSHSQVRAFGRQLGNLTLWLRCVIGLWHRVFEHLATIRLQPSDA